MNISTELYIFLISASIICLIFSVISIIMGGIAVFKVLAMEKSTHSITYMPIDPEVDKENSEYMKNWATQDASLEKQSKVYKEDLEETMPEFVSDDDDLKIHSF